MADKFQQEIFVSDTQSFPFGANSNAEKEQKDGNGEVCLKDTLKDPKLSCEKDFIESTSRKSQRLKREKRSFSPTPTKDGTSTRKKKRRKVTSVGGEVETTVTVRSCDKLPDGTMFCCDLCKSPYVCNPGRRGNRFKVSKHKPLPRHRYDPNTGKVLTLCNACGLAFERPTKVSKAKAPLTAAEKAKYLDEARTFALSLVEGLNDPDAERLCCVYITSKPCACMQQYIIGDSNLEQSRQRASQLLALLKEAKRLITQKSYDVFDVTAKGKRRAPIGLGNGHKRSKAYEEFVLKTRKSLREEVKLCEQATQRILLYSNNFLHKRLKTEDRERRVLSKGKAALGLLTPVTELHNEKCCTDNCVRMSLTHGHLLQQWRERAKTGQLEARLVLAEMLTPSGGARCNCYKFINWVTGCSHSTISRVSEQMKRTGGDRTPPEHGLKKYWQEQKAKKSSVHSVVTSAVAPHIDSSSSNMQIQLSTDTPNVPLQAQRQQLLQLQRQITQQQLQLQQQQQLLQQSLHQVAQSDSVQLPNTYTIVQPAPPTASNPEVRVPPQLVPDFTTATVTNMVPAAMSTGGATGVVQEQEVDQVWNTQTISIGNINYTVVIQPTGETTLLSVNPSASSLDSPTLETQTTGEESNDSGVEQTLSSDMVLLLGQHGISLVADKVGE